VSEQHSTIPMAWISLQTALHRVVAGQPDDALRWARISVELWRSSGLFGRLRWPQGVVALSLAMLGRGDEAQQQMELLDVIDTPVHLNEASVLEARAWTLAANGAMEDARALLLEAGQLGIEMGQRTCAVAALHSLARLGGPEAAWPVLRELAPDLQGRLMAARVAHVEALAARDGEALLEAATGLEAVGSWLAAAEAAADAARAFRKAGRARDATAAAQRSKTLAERCPGARTPGLALTETVSPLTRREREVAMLAAQGLASKAIAEKLYLSVRTVDNHLSRAYEKLGVSGRDGLAAIADQL
jgi:DNA-binding NarL/FixJ family response regulator